MTKARVILQQLKSNTKALPGESLPMARNRLAREHGYKSFDNLRDAAKKEKAEARASLSLFIEHVRTSLTETFPGTELIRVDQSGDTNSVYYKFVRGERRNALAMIRFCESDLSNPLCAFIDKADKLIPCPTENLPTFAVCPGHDIPFRFRNAPLYRQMFELVRIEDQRKSIAPSQSSEKVKDAKAFFPYKEWFASKKLRQLISTERYTFFSKRQGPFLQGLLIVEVGNGNYLKAFQNALSTDQREFDLIMLKHLALAAIDIAMSRNGPAEVLNLTEAFGCTQKFTQRNPIDLEAWDHLNLRRQGLFLDYYIKLRNEWAQDDDNIYAPLIGKTKDYAKVVQLLKKYMAEREASTVNGILTQFAQGSFGRQTRTGTASS